MSKEPIEAVTCLEKDKNPEGYQKRRSKLFSTVVNNSATITAKRELGKVSLQFIKMDRRGTAVVIGPLEYCGNGIAIKSTRGKTV